MPKMRDNKAMRFFNCFNDRLDLQEIFDDISSKFVPPHNIRRMAVWAIFYCFGGLLLTAFLVQVATGFALTFYYHPSGWLIRSGHRWGASVMVC